MKEDKYIQTTIDKITGYLGILSDPAFSVVVGIVRQALLAAIQYGREDALGEASIQIHSACKRAEATGATKERERIIALLPEEGDEDIKVSRNAALRIIHALITTPQENK